MNDKNLAFDSVTETITTIVKDIGMPAGRLGYDYTRYGIRLALEDKTILRRMTTAFYPAIAERFDTTASKVERAIRGAVEAACDRSSPDLLEKYFGNTIPPNKGKPTNREFVAILADSVLLALGEAPAVYVDGPPGRKEAV